MTDAEARRLAQAVVDRYPKTYAEELGIRSLETPSGLFQLFVMAMLMSARIGASIAHAAARALFRRRWTTARAMAASSWAERAKVLNEAGNARYDERTSTMLGEDAELLLDRYRGDLRRLRDAAERDPTTERRLLKELKGIGDVGVDIFFREAQRSWTELRPFADRRALKAAKRLGLGPNAEALGELTGDGDDVRPSGRWPGTGRPRRRLRPIDRRGMTGPRRPARARTPGLAGRWPRAARPRPPSTARSWRPTCSSCCPAAWSSTTGPRSSRPWPARPGAPSSSRTSGSCRSGPTAALVAYRARRPTGGQRLRGARRQHVRA